LKHIKINLQGVKFMSKALTCFLLARLLQFAHQNLLNSTRALRKNGIIDKLLQ